MSEIATISNFRYWVVFLLLVTIAGEFFIFQYKLNQNPNYQWNLLVKEQENFKMVADREDIEAIINVINNVDNFMKGALRRAYSGIESWFKPMMQLVIIRGYMYKFMLPLFVIAVIIGFVEGKIRYQRKEEEFGIVSALGFHWVKNLALSAKLLFIFGYLFSPLPINPFLFIYGVPAISFLIIFFMRSNIPLGKL
ncbi:DUF4400 domain-containing protein [Deferribacter abyssi]|uniref:DUF4400 domain-containing protein n=1 Tax=Deferribacter abyssi TaxID=213806 RepID=UPI003C28A11F